MNNTGTIIFVVFVLIVPWLLFIIYILTANKSIVKNFKTFGDKYGFEVDTSKKSGLYRHPVSDGSYRSIPVVIGSFNKEEGRKKYPATYVEADCLNPGNLEFLIVKKTNANSIKYGSKDFSAGDSEFDEKFIVNTNNTDRMFHLLNFSIKYKLIQSINVGFKGELTLNNNKLRYAEKELIKSKMNLLRIEIMLHLLCEIAEELNDNKS